MKKSSTSMISLDKEFVQRYLNLEQLLLTEETTNIEDEQNTDLSCIFKMSPSSLLNNDILLPRRAAIAKHESYQYDWNIESKILDEWQERLKSPMQSLENPNDDFNYEILENPELYLSSPSFQCGKMIDRCANWHLELRIVEPLDKVYDSKNIGLFIFMDDATTGCTASNEQISNQVAVDVYTNVQILSKTGSIFKSLKSDLLKFGHKSEDSVIQSTYFPSLLSWEEFLKVKSNLIGGSKNCLQLRVKMDLSREHMPLSKKINPLTGVVSPKAVKNPDCSDDDGVEEDPIIAQSSFKKAEDIEKGMKQLLISGEGADIQILINGRDKLQVHEEIIQIRAPGLAILINDNKTIQLDNSFDLQTIRTLIEYLYTDKIKYNPMAFNPRQIHQLLETAELFEIQNLKNDLIDSMAESLGMKGQMGSRSCKKSSEFSTPSTVLVESKIATIISKEDRDIDEKFLAGMKEFSQKSKVEQDALSQICVELFRKSTPQLSNSKKVADSKDSKAKVSRIDLKNVGNKKLLSKAETKTTSAKPGQVGKHALDKSNIGKPTLKKIPGRTALINSTATKSPDQQKPKNNSTTTKNESRAIPKMPTQNLKPIPSKLKILRKVTEKPAAGSTRGTASTRPTSITGTANTKNTTTAASKIRKPENVPKPRKPSADEGKSSIVADKITKKFTAAPKIPTKECVHNSMSLIKGPKNTKK